MLDFEEARAHLLAAAQPVREIDEIDTLHASGRILACAQHAPFNVPEQACSTMDGYAVRTADLPAPGIVLPVHQRIAAGSIGHPLAPASAARIFTGAPLPPGADAVVMQELTEPVAHGIRFQHAPHVGEAVRSAGSDIAQGAEVLAAGCRLSAPQIALAASIGCARLPVLRRVRVALFSTGSELHMPGEPLPPGGIYNSNRYLLRSLLEALGCVIEDLGIVPDSLDATRAALRQASTFSDLILTSGGVSVGEEDHVKPAVEAEGHLDLWKIAMKPGKPLAYGKVGSAAFIGLPGNPVSSFVTFLLMVRPFVLKLQGCSEVLPKRLRLRAAFDWPRPDRRREFARARLNERGEVVIHPNQSASALLSTAWADGLVEIPPSTVLQAGDEVHYLPYCELLG